MMELRKLEVNFLVLALCLGTINLFAQESQSGIFSYSQESYSFWLRFHQADSEKTYSTLKAPLPALEYLRVPSKSPFFPNPYAPPEAFFCRIEKITADRIKFPFIFRLGDVDKVNKLERKTNFDILTNEYK